MATTIPMTTAVPTEVDVIIIGGLSSPSPTFQDTY